MEAIQELFIELTNRYGVAKLVEQVRSLLTSTGKKGKFSTIHS